MRELKTQILQKYNSLITIEGKQEFIRQLRLIIDLLGRDYSSHYTWCGNCGENIELKDVKVAAEKCIKEYDGGSLGKVSRETTELRYRCPKCNGLLMTGYWDEVFKLQSEEKSNEGF